jgi:hypothetical protein
MIIEIDKNSHLEWTHSIINFFLFTLINREKREMTILRPLKQKYFNLKRYINGTYEQFPISVKTDMQLFPVEFIDYIAFEKENNIVYYKDKLVIPKQKHWSAYSIHPWVSHQVYRDIILKDLRGNKIIYNDSNIVQGKMPTFESIVNSFHLHPFTKNWLLTLGKTVNSGLQMISIIDNYLVDIKGLNKIIVGQIREKKEEKGKEKDIGISLNKDIDEDNLEIFMKFVRLSALEIQTHNVLNVKIKTQDSVWKSMNIFKFSNPQDIDKLMPRLWFRRSSPQAYYYYSEDQTKWINTLLASEIEERYTTELISLQNSRGNLKMDVLIKLLKALSFEGKNVEKERNLLYYLLTDASKFHTDLRLDHVIHWISEEYLENKEIKYLLSTATLIKNDMMQENKNKILSSIY